MAAITAPMCMQAMFRLRISFSTALMLAAPVPAVLQQAGAHALITPKTQTPRQPVLQAYLQTSSFAPASVALTA